MSDYLNAFNIKPNSENFYFVKFPYKSTKQSELLCFDIKRGLLKCNKCNKCINHVTNHDSHNYANTMNHANHANTINTITCNNCK